jgi:hypothetical protein
MVEITHGGAWFKWSSMNRRDRFWFVLSTAAMMPASVMSGIAVGRFTYRIGYWLGSGKHGPDGLRPLVESDGHSYAAIAACLLLLVGFFGWWRFSVAQDEMFNRLQNYALGRAGAWMLAIAAAWWMLSLGGWIEELPLVAIVNGGLFLTLGFWIHAVRKWT